MYTEIIWSGTVVWSFLIEKRKCFYVFSENVFNKTQIYRAEIKETAVEVVLFILLLAVNEP